VEASLGNPVSPAKVGASGVQKAVLPLVVVKAASVVRPPKAMRQSLKATSQKIRPDHSAFHS
jgi:hypothetical protein